MRSSVSLRLSLAALGVGASLGGSCTAATGPSFPASAVPVPPSFTLLSVAGLPSSCAAKVFFEASTALCAAGRTYLLCDGSSYTAYDCSAPGNGWTLETLSQYDRVSSAPTACNGSPGAEGSLNGTVYVEGNAAAPGQNSILVFRYCNGALPSLPVARYLTGGSGAADLNNSGVLDADQQLVTSEDRTLLFAVNQGSDSIAVFHVAGDGLLTPVAGSPFPSGGSAPASVGVRGNVLVVANKAVDGLRALGNVAPSYVTFSIEADGSLRPTGSKYELAAGASPTQAFVAPGGKLVFGTEESGVLRGFQLSASGALTLAPSAPVALASSLFHDGRPNPVWPAGLSASPTHPVLYTGVPNNDSIAAFDYDAEGSLSLIGGEADPNAFLPCWSLVNADGSRLYFANAGSDNISVWDVATDARHPRLLQTFELSGGGNPWGLHIDPKGQLLFVITPRQIHQVPEGQGQLLHGLRIARDGTLADVVDGSPVTLPLPTDTNPFGVAVVAAR